MIVKAPGTHFAASLILLCAIKTIIALMIEISALHRGIVFLHTALNLHRCSTMAGFTPFETSRRGLYEGKAYQELFNVNILKIYLE